MPLNTPLFNLPYPISSDAVNVHIDIKDLAEAVESNLGNIAELTNSNIFTATNTFSATSANPVITVTQAGSGPALSTTGKIVAGEFELSGGTSSQFLKADGSTDSSSYSLSNHTHGNITNDGKIGSTSGQVVITTTAGALTTLTAGTSGQFLANNATWATPPDTNTTYTFGSGTTNGAFSVTPSGGSAESVSIFGLGTAAYTASTDYATSSHTHSFQPLDSDLTELSGLNATNGQTGFLRRQANNTYTFDTNNYLTSVTTHVSTHESGGTDEMRGALQYRDVASTATFNLTLSNVDYGLNRMNRITGTSAMNIVLPSNSTASIPIGTQIHFILTGANTNIVQFTAGSGATLRSNASKVKFNGQYAVATAIKLDTNEWSVFGNLIA